jgi:hypothetical protein
MLPGALFNRIDSERVVRELNTLRVSGRESGRQLLAPNVEAKAASSTAGRSV